MPTGEGTLKSSLSVTLSNSPSRTFSSNSGNVHLHNSAVLDFTRPASQSPTPAPTPAPRAGRVSPRVQPLQETNIAPTKRPTSPQPPSTSGQQASGKTGGGKKKAKKTPKKSPTKGTALSLNVMVAKKEDEDHVSGADADDETPTPTPSASAASVLVAAERVDIRDESHHQANYVPVDRNANGNGNGALKANGNGIVTEPDEDDDDDENDACVTMNGTNAGVVTASNYSVVDLNEDGVERYDPDQRRSRALADKLALSRSESILVRLQKYQSAVAGQRLREDSPSSSSSSTLCSSDSEGDNDSDAEGTFTKLNGSGSTGSGSASGGGSGSRRTSTSDLIRAAKVGRREKVLKFKAMNDIKSKWESGKVEEGATTGGRASSRDDIKDDLHELRRRLCLGRSESMRQVFEKSIRNGSVVGLENGNGVGEGPVRSTTGQVDLSDGSGGPVTVRANDLRKKFELGINNSKSHDDEADGDVGEEDLDLQEKLRREKIAELKRIQADAECARAARSIFKKIDNRAVRQATTATTGSNGVNGRPSSVQGTAATGPLTKSATSANVSGRWAFQRGSASFATRDASDVDGEIVRSDSTAASKDDLQIDTDALQERFKFFENFREAPKEPKRFQITPPRDLPPESVSASLVGQQNGADEPVARDPNIIRASDPVEPDLPRSDTARKMLSKFKEMESQLGKDEKPIGPKPLKRITPPREAESLSTHLNGNGIAHHANGLNGSTHNGNGHISMCDREAAEREEQERAEAALLEAERVRKMKSRFENWTSIERERDGSERSRSNSEASSGHDLGLGGEAAENVPAADMAKNLRAKWEAFKEQNTTPLKSNEPLNRPKAKINRFVN